MHFATQPDWVALSSPSAGKPLVPQVERFARKLRKTAEFLERNASLSFSELFKPTREGLGYVVSDSDVQSRIAWALIGEWLVAAATGHRSAREGIVATHAWFWSGQTGSGTIPDIEIELGDLDSSEIFALMPYLLDANDAATRRDVLGRQSNLTNTGDTSRVAEPPVTGHSALTRDR